MNWIAEHWHWLGLVGGLGVVGLAWWFLGWRGAVAAAVGVASWLLYQKGRSEGAKNERARELERANKTVDRARAARARARSRELHENDGFRRD